MEDIINDPALKNIANALQQDPSLVTFQDEGFDQLCDKLSTMMGPEKDIKKVFDSLGEHFKDVKSGFCLQDGTEVTMKEMLDYQYQISMQCVEENTPTEELAQKYMDLLHNKFKMTSL